MLQIVIGITLFKKREVPPTLSRSNVFTTTSFSSITTVESYFALEKGVYLEVAYYQVNM